MTEEYYTYRVIAGNQDPSDATKLISSVTIDVEATSEGEALEKAKQRLKRSNFYVSNIFVNYSKMQTENQFKIIDMMKDNWDKMFSHDKSE